MPNAEGKSEDDLPRFVASPTQILMLILNWLSVLTFAQA